LGGFLGRDTMNIAAMGILIQVLRGHIFSFLLGKYLGAGFLGPSVADVNPPGCGWMSIFIHVCSKYEIKRPLVATPSKVGEFQRQTFP